MATTRKLIQTSTSLEKQHPPPPATPTPSPPVAELPAPSLHQGLHTQLRENLVTTRGDSILLIPTAQLSRVVSRPLSIVRGDPVWSALPLPNTPVRKHLQPPAPLAPPPPPPSRHPHPPMILPFSPLPWSVGKGFQLE